jgi:hypothetical protein
MCNQFINDRLTTGDKGIWDTLSRSKVKSFTFIQPSKNNLVIALKAWDKLQDLMIVIRSRKVSEFEFDIVPVFPFFASSGELYAATDKSKIVKVMENLSEDCSVKQL